MPSEIVQIMYIPFAIIVEILLFRQRNEKIQILLKVHINIKFISALLSNLNRELSK